MALLLVFGTAADARADSQPSVRTWSDSTGKYKIQGKFIALNDGKVTVQLVDGKQVEIELDKLSKPDQEYVKTVKPSADNPFKPVDKDPFQPKSAQQSQSRVVVPNWRAARSISLVPQKNAWEFSIAADADSPSQFRGRPVALPRTSDFFEQVENFVLNAASRRAVVGYSLDRPGRGTATTRLQFCGLESGKILRDETIPGNYVPIALHDDGKRILLRSNDFGINKQDRLELWTLTDSQIQQTLSWAPYDQNERDRDVAWAAFFGQDRLATLSKSGKLAVWSIDNARLHYWAQFDRNCTPAVSPDGKYLAFVLKRKVGVLDLDRGELLAFTQAPDATWGSVAFSPSGRRLACLSHTSKLYVWNFADGQLYREISLTHASGSGGLLWPSEDHVLINKSLLVELRNQVNLWTYQGHDFVEFDGSVCWFLLNSNHRNSGALVYLNLPHSGVQEKLKQALSDPDFFVLRPGVTVKLNVNGIPDPSKRREIQDALTKKLTDNGFRVGPQGTIELVASATDTAKRQEVNFRSIGRGFGSAQTHQVREFISQMKFVHQGETAWQTQTTNVPTFLTLEEGETVASALRKHEKPNYNFFTHVQLPTRLAKPSAARSVGTSRITPTGLR